TNGANGIQIEQSARARLSGAISDIADVYTPNISSYEVPMVRAGSVRAIAVTSTKRSSLAPEIPTMAEVGLPELNFGAWWAIWGPPGMAADLVQTINGWVNDVVKDLAAEGRLAALGIEAVSGDLSQAISNAAPSSSRAANFQPE